MAQIALPRDVASAVIVRGLAAAQRAIVIAVVVVVIVAVVEALTVRGAAAVVSLRCQEASGRREEVWRAEAPPRG